MFVWQARYLPHCVAVGRLGRMAESLTNDSIENTNPTGSESVINVNPCDICGKIDSW